MRDTRINTDKLHILPVPEDMVLHVKHHPFPDYIHFSYMYKGVIRCPSYVTEAWLTNKNTGERVSYARACCSEFDTPNKKFGYVIAVNRVIKNFRKLRDENTDSQSLGNVFGDFAYMFSK
jgi:hypothetical protein